MSTRAASGWMFLPRAPGVTTSVSCPAHPPLASPLRTCPQPPASVLSHTGADTRGQSRVLNQPPAAHRSVPARCASALHTLALRGAVLARVPCVRAPPPRQLQPVCKPKLGTGAGAAGSRGRRGCAHTPRCRPRAPAPGAGEVLRAQQAQGAARHPAAHTPRRHWRTVEVRGSITLQHLLSHQRTR